MQKDSDLIWVIVRFLLRMLRDAISWTYSLYTCISFNVSALFFFFFFCSCFFFRRLISIFFSFFFCPTAIVLRWWFSSCVEESWGREPQWQKFGNGYSLASSVWNASVHSRYGKIATRYQCDSWKLKVAIVLSFYGKYSMHKLNQERMKNKALNLP